jgi:Arc/MetJ-type ribon-helix-helix transcriptional regulator
MRDFSLPTHLVAWSEGQVALGRAASLSAYVAQLVAEDRDLQEKLINRRAAMAEARASGISMQPADAFLADWLSDEQAPGRERLRAAIREGRESGYSRASLDGILARALISGTAQAA